MKWGKRNRGRTRGDAKTPIPLHEWANVGIAAAALLLALVSFWTTARISGIEDYLRSEIARRNSDLNALASRSSALEQSTLLQQQSVARLQVETDRLLASALQNERRMSESGLSLSELKNAVTLERANLADARRESAKASQLAQEQAHTLDILARRKVYESLVFGISAYAIGMMEGQEKSGVLKRGQEIHDFMQNYAVRADDHAMAPAVRRLKENLPFVCPDLRSRTITVVDVPLPKRTWPDLNRRFLTQKRADAYAEGFIKKAKDDNAAYVATFQANFEKERAAAYALRDYGWDCACLALGGGASGPDEICRLTTAKASAKD